MKEELVECKRCGGNACVERSSENSTKEYFCFGCGFVTNSNLLSESTEWQKSKEVLPNLYMDLSSEFGGTMWYPSHISLPEKGMVFVYGSSIDDWKWCGAKMSPILEEEREKFPQDQTHKLDTSTLKFFGHFDFMDALEYIGFFQLAKEN